MVLDAAHIGRFAEINLDTFETVLGRCLEFCKPIKMLADKWFSDASHEADTCAPTAILLELGRTYRDCGGRCVTCMKTGSKVLKGLANMQKNLTDMEEYLRNVPSMQPREFHLYSEHTNPRTIVVAFNDSLIKQIQMCDRASANEMDLSGPTKFSRPRASRLRSEATMIAAYRNLFILGMICAILNLY